MAERTSGRTELSSRGIGGEMTRETIKGSMTDGTIDGSYLRSKTATEIALEGMTEAGREKYNEALNNLARVSEVGSEDDRSSFSKKQRLTATTVAATLLTGVGVAAVGSLSPSEARAENGIEIAAKSTLPSQEALAGYNIRSESNHEPVSALGISEAIPSVLDMVTGRYLQETLDQIMDFDVPIPVERCENIFEDWKLKTFGPYERELRSLGATDEDRIEWGAKVLYAYKNSDQLTGSSEEKFQSYISRQEIVDYVLTGKNERVFCDEEGRPVFLLVNFTDKMIKNFRAAVKKLEKSGVNNVYDSWHDSGACVFFTAELLPGLGSAEALLNKFGVVGFNMTESNTKKVPDRGLTNQFARNIHVEPIGVAYLQRTEALGMNYLEEIVGPRWIGYGEIVKDWIYGKIAANFNGELKGLSKDMLMQAEDKANDHRLSVDSDLSKRQIQLILETVEVMGEDLYR